MPDAELIRASGDAALAGETARHAWAGWLVGVLLVYGVLPRLLLGLFCLWRWKRGLAGLDLDLDDPGYSLLRERLMPASERLGVSDAAPDWLPEPQGGQSAQEAAGAVLVAVELDDRRPWPPKLAEGIADAGILDDGQQRRRLLEQLTRYPPARLAIACDPRRSRPAPLAGPRHPGAARRTRPLRRQHPHLAAPGSARRSARQRPPGRLARRPGTPATAARRDLAAGLAGDRP
ncbi:putative integral membrane protein [Pseudomonas paraeruginosa]|nr:putative integral membrane protein [Pseudomonas aeruginosa]